MADWNDKVVVVTGGSAGLGRYIAREFAQRGAKVVIAARNQQQLDATVKELQDAGHDVSVLATDVTNQDDVDGLFSYVNETYSRLDVLVNNAGASSRGEAIDTSVADFRALIDLNFLSVVRCTRAAIPQLLKSQGHLVNIGSLAAKTVSRYLGAYPASKFPVAAYTHQLRLELASQGLHVLLVCPGPIAMPESDRRYQDWAAQKQLPESAGRPGAGVKLKGLDPTWLARRIVRGCERRQPELVAPLRARVVLAASAVWPRLGDWIIGVMTGTGN